MSAQNLAVKLCGILQSQTDEEITAREWRLIGQEQEGSQMFSWVSTAKNNTEQLHIGIYTKKTNILETLYTFEERLNVIQASVNASHTLLVYVVKLLQNPELSEPLYCPYLVSLLTDKDNTPIKVEESSTKQIMVQYVYGKSYKYSPGMKNDRFLLFKHLENIKIYHTYLTCIEQDDGTEDWNFDAKLPRSDIVVKVFSWAQWDCVNQVLYYIHYRQPTQSFAEGEEVKSPSEVTPTLTALQFHADLPHETVLNIPLNIPQLPASGGDACGSYEDDAVPLRVHDCSLDLQIVCDPAGVLAICHHYLYKPLDESMSSLLLEDSTELKESGVNFAYSITLLHRGCVVHTVVPELPWARAKALRPSYTLFGDDQLLINIPMLFTQILDMSVTHEPCSHIVIPNEEETAPSLAPLVGWGPNTTVDMNTLDVVTLNVSDRELVSTFKSNTSIENKLAILHYLIMHDANIELAEELIAWLALNQSDIFSLHSAMQEYLVGSTHSITRRSLAAPALPVMDMLPFTVHLKFADVKVGSQCVSVTQEKLWNSSVVVLAPRQRLRPFAEDVWTRLHTALNPVRQVTRLKQDAVRDKLAHTIQSYQPEALSRCTTPRSPTGGGGPAFPSAPRRSSLTAAGDGLPFFELDLCTASRQEHVSAVNVRVVSAHLLGAGSVSLESGAGGAAARWACAQVDSARTLCRVLCTAAGAQVTAAHQRGFTFIDDLEPVHAHILFKLLEQYYLAVDSIAFPLPQGFMSFFTYLGYRAMPFYAFTQYLHRGVFELQIDVLKHILTGDDDRPQSVDNILRLIQLVGSGRARRALAAWPNRAALALRARDHAAALLTGGAPPRRDNAKMRTHRGAAGIAALPSGERLSPLDTFLDLLTAKASLNELDFNLIIEATLASVQEEATA